jgi:hypothetical protein
MRARLLDSNRTSSTHLFRPYLLSRLAGRALLCGWRGYERLARQRLHEPYEACEDGRHDREYKPSDDDFLDYADVPRDLDKASARREFRGCVRKWKPALFTADGGVLRYRLARTACLHGPILYPATSEAFGHYWEPPIGGGTGQVPKNPISPQKQHHPANGVIGRLC